MSVAFGVLCLTLAMACIPAPSYAGQQASTVRQAEKAVKKALGSGRAAVRCRVKGSRRLGRYVCSWRRSAAGHSCRGQHSATRQGRRWRVRRVSKACKPPSRSNPVAAQPAGAGSSAPPVTADHPGPPAKRAPIFGFNDNSVPRGTVSAGDDARLTDALGATSVRYTVDWRWAEPTPGDIRLETYDAVYDAMVARGIRPILIPSFAPSWAMEPGTCNQWYTDCKYPPARDHADDYARFAALLARRYPKAAAVEIWNEPNQNFFWQSGPDPELYSHVLAASYRRIKQVAPDMTVLAGGIADNPTTRDGMPPGPFLRALYANGLRGSMDAISIHPYPQLLDQTLAEVRGIRDAAGDSGRKLWLTETGYSTTGTRSTTWPSWWAVSEAQQATSLVALHDRLTAMSDVEAVLFHTLVEPRGDRLMTPGPGYGVVREEGLRPKPAFCALARARSASGRSSPGCS